MDMLDFVMGFVANHWLLILIVTLAASYLLARFNRPDFQNYRLIAMKKIRGVKIDEYMVHPAIHFTDVTLTFDDGTEIETDETIDFLGYEFQKEIKLHIYQGEGEQLLSCEELTQEKFDAQQSVIGDAFKIFLGLLVVEFVIFVILLFIGLFI